MTLLRTQLGTTLRGHRLRQRRTLRDVSGRARVSLGYLSEVERGQKEASSELLASICDALELELADLLAEVSLELRGISTGQDGALRPLAPASGDSGRRGCPLPRWNRLPPSPPSRSWAPLRRAPRSARARRSRSPPDRSGSAQWQCRVSTSRSWTWSGVPR